MATPEPTPTAGPPPAGPGRSPVESAAWIREYLDAVYRYAAKRLPPGEAEDVAQQAFAALFGAQARGRTPDDPGAYLLGVARRRVADRHRARRRRPEPVALPEGWEGFCDRLLPDEVLLQREMRDLVHVALGLLPTDVRSLLQQRYRGRAPVAEIAERLGVTVKAVEMRLARARALFARRFHEVGGSWRDRESEASDT